MALLRKRRAQTPGTEFASLRAYAAGEDAARIDWLASARAGSTQVRVFDPESSLVFAAIVDESKSMHAGRSRALLESAREARNAWFAAADAGDRCLPLVLRGPFFDLRAALRRANALPRASALLLAGDWHGLAREHEPMLRAAARRLDCTALVARDPWRAHFPLRGFVRVGDSESGETAVLFIGPAQRRRYAAFMRDREARVLQSLRVCGWRAASFDERHGARALLRAFGAA